jgi:hypothetical protein
MQQITSWLPRLGWRNPSPRLLTLLERARTGRIHNRPLLSKFAFHVLFCRFSLPLSLYEDFAPAPAVDTLRALDRYSIARGGLPVRASRRRRQRNASVGWGLSDIFTQTPNRQIGLQIPARKSRGVESACRGLRGSIRYVRLENGLRRWPAL